VGLVLLQDLVKFLEDLNSPYKKVIENGYICKFIKWLKITFFSFYSLTKNGIIVTQKMCRLRAMDTENGTAVSLSIQVGDR